jgi:hypothetical protein
MTINRVAKGVDVMVGVSVIVGVYLLVSVAVIVAVDVAVKVAETVGVGVSLGSCINGLAKADWSPPVKAAKRDNPKTPAANRRRQTLAMFHGNRKKDKETTSKTKANKKCREWGSRQPDDPFSIAANEVQPPA